MRLIKQIEAQRQEMLIEIEEITINLFENCANLQLPVVAVPVLLENAEAFLGNLATKLAGGAFKLDPEDNELKNAIALYTVLQLLQGKQAREVTKVDTLKDYLRVVQNISTDFHSSIDAQITQELDQMRAPSGISGLEQRKRYVDQIIHGDIQKFVQEVKKLESKYRNIQIELKKRIDAGSQQAPAQTNNQVVNSNPQQATAGSSKPTVADTGLRAKVAKRATADNRTLGNFATAPTRNFK